MVTKAREFDNTDCPPRQGTKTLFPWLFAQTRF